MLLGGLVGGLVSAGLTLAVRRRTGWTWAVTLGLFVWSLIGLGVVTLLPADGAPGIVFAEDRLDHCSWDIGGPAPEGFWIVAGGQRLLNTLVFVPSGALLVLVAARWPRTAWVSVPVGFALLAAYSVGIELTQLALARLDRACDVTDVIDNVTGAAIGVLAGVVLALVLRPWRSRAVRPPSGG
jgi:hypothetical protein